MSSAIESFLPNDCRGGYFLIVFSHADNCCTTRIPAACKEEESSLVADGKETEIEGEAGKTSEDETSASDEKESEEGRKRRRDAEEIPTNARCQRRGEGGIEGRRFWKRIPAGEQPMEEAAEVMEKPEEAESERGGSGGGRRGRRRGGGRNEGGGCRI